jgi:ubiquinol-cytochrome c reductase cytochrome c1 subunit
MNERTSEMIRKLTLSAMAALTLSTSSVLAAGAAGHVTDYQFSFEGPFGTWDENQLQRGMKVYTQVCSACHGLQYVPIRTLTDIGFTEEEVRVYAEQNFEVYDDEAEEFRAARPTDNFPANEALGAPDLSLMAKARAGFHGPYGLGINQLVKGMGGAEYIASLLTHYTGGDKMEAGTLLYENETYPGGYINMAPPLYGDDVVYDDGTEATIEQQAKDVAAFLMWTAEPKLMARKEAGFVSVLFLVVLAVLLYLTNKRIWAPIKRKVKEG